MAEEAVHEAVEENEGEETLLLRLMVAGRNRLSSKNGVGTGLVGQELLRYERSTLCIRCCGSRVAMRCRAGRSVSFYVPVADAGAAAWGSYACSCYIGAYLLLARCSCSA
ncbi:hypothetical protein NPIL_203071 [Nephila pilipes]|uniref:Uncharacterized protein n=1 Tax=Nephila pilipes TaxID=299642 RepID=A0A8X6UPW3_NEPPI|nr:hypothetical protein NPIL_203071 [Nephila pilipes]